MVNYEVPRCSKICTATGRELMPGEWFYSVLLAEKGEIQRLDYSQDGWQGAPSYQADDEIHLIGYWKSRLPTPNDNKVKLAPNDILLNLFDQLGDQLDKQDMRYVLVLLLIRRRIFRLERTADRSADEEPDAETGHHRSRVATPPTLTVYCPKRETVYRIPVIHPSDEQVEQMQETLTGLLYAG